MSGEQDVDPEGGERRPVPHVRDAVRASAWAITDEAMQTIVAIVERTNDVTLTALEAYRARRAQGTETMTVRDGVAVISIAGPLMRYADLFAAISGATSYEDLRRDLQAAVDRPDVRAILLTVDSPGGMVNGANEMADAIRAASALKPLQAYVGGQAASAAYWLAAAAQRVTIEATAMVGSIGVRQGYRDTSERDARSGVKTIEFVSSQSPHKVVDPQAPAGQKKIQKVVDDLAGVFVGSVAKHRGISTEDVIAKFGGGGVKIGAEAVEAGMADVLGTFEGTLRALAATPVTFPGAKGLRSMSDEKTHTAADLSGARAEGAQATRERIKAIVTLPEAEGRRQLAEHLAYDTEMTVDAAKAMLATAGKDTPATGDTAATKPPPVADTAGRARDAAGGLALTSFTEQQAQGQNEQKPAPKAIDSTKIYGRLNGNRT